MITMNNISINITDEGLVEFYCTKINTNEEICIWFDVSFYKTGRCEEIELNISDFNDEISEKFYDENYGDVENEITIRLTKTDIEKIKLNK